jgi:hypothetical protein
MLPWASESFQGAVRWSEVPRAASGLRRARRGGRCLSAGPRGGRRLGGGRCRCLSAGPRGGRRLGGGGCRCLPGGPRGGRRSGAGCRCLVIGPRGGRWPGGGDALGWLLPVCWPPRGSASGRWPSPLPVYWPPRGSASGRWRCRCLPGGPRGGRRSGAGCHCLPGGPRGGRRSGAGVRARVPFGGVCCLRGSGGAPKSAAGAGGGGVVPRDGSGGAPRSAGGAVRGADASKPRAGPPRRAPEGGWSVGPVGRLAAPPRGVGPSVLGGPSCCASEEARWVGSWGMRGWRVSPLRRGAAVPAASVRPRPRGGLGSRRPPVASWVGWGKPRPIRRPPGIVLPRKGERVHRGGDSSRLEESLPAPPRRGCQARGCSAGAEALLVRLRFRVCLTGAEASVVRLRRPLRGLSAPPRGVGLPGCGDVPWSVRPEGFLDSCFAEARQGRHGVSLFGRARGPVRVPALPKRCWADTSRPTKVGWVPVPPRRFRGCVLGCPRTRRR